MREVGAEGAGRREVPARERAEVRCQARRRQGSAAFRLEVQEVTVLAPYAGRRKIGAAGFDK